MVKGKINNTQKRKKRGKKTKKHEKKRAFPLLAAFVDNWGQFLGGGILFAGICVLTVIGGPSLGFVLGRPAPENYRSPISFEYYAHRETRSLTEQARHNAPLAFRSNLSQFNASAAQIKRVIETRDVEKVRENLDFRNEKIADTLSLLNQNQDVLERIFENLKEAEMVSHYDWGEHAPRMPDSILWPNGAQETRKVPVDDVIIINPQCEKFQRILEPAFAGLDAEQRHIAISFIAEMLAAPAKLDIERSEKIAEEKADIPTVVKDIEKGDLLVRKGELVGLEAMRMIRAAHSKHLSEQRGFPYLFRRLGGGMLILLIYGGVISLYTIKNRTDRRLRDHAVQCIVLVLLILAVFAIARASIFYGLPYYIVPLSALIMIFALIFGQRFAFIISAFLPAAIALPAGDIGVEYPVFMIGGMTAALMIGRVRTRSHLFRVALLIGVAQAGVCLAFGLLAAESNLGPLLRFWGSPLLFSTFLAFGNGLLSGVLVTIFLPAVERIFEVTTDIRLLEWSDPNQPLLQRMLLEAPGTYHHSMIVGSLAADAAEVVGANPLLTRVSAYFHDVGKVKKPEYFAENMQEGAKNPHDELAPTMSKLIITAHPKDGAEMATESGLPPAVQSVILQSHGTTMASYFWNRAQKQASKEDAPPEKDAFRYKLPKPQSKEAACVMLADAVESATRSLESPGTEKIKEVVHKIVLDRLHDGQLDHSDLTIPDLSRLQQALIRGLTALFHKRVKYPDQEENGKK